MDGFRAEVNMRKYSKGVTIVEGIAIGKASILFRDSIDTKNIAYIIGNEYEKEIALFEATRQTVLEKINELQSNMKKKNPEEAKIFDAHAEIVKDPELEKKVRLLIKQKNYTCRSALLVSFKEISNMLEQIDDELIKERAKDIEDIGKMFIDTIDGDKNKNANMFYEEGTILIAEELFPSDLASVSKDYIKGIALSKGSATSHVAIMAKGLKIPTVFGITGITDMIKQGDEIIIDGYNGTIYENPDSATLDKYNDLKKNYETKQKKERDILKRIPFTTDKTRIDLAVNIGSSNSYKPEIAQFTDGVGLMRTEFLFMERNDFPSEEEQFDVYRSVLQDFAGKPVVLRTLDIGGDKKLNYLPLPEEENPFLGCRAIRLCFENPEIMHTQLRAAFRASAYGNLQIMYPMVGSLDDWNRIQGFVEKVKKELQEKNIPFGLIKQGIMIEIPSIVMLAEEISKEVDFASIGTNDLAQYLTATDRMSDLVRPYYQSFTPGLFRFIKIAIDAFHKNKKPLSVCGELGGDPRGAAILIGMGIRKLSVSPSLLANIKELVTTKSLVELEEIAENVLNFGKQDEVLDYINKKL